MPAIDKKITIDVPLETVFDFVIKPGNLPKVWPSLVKIDNEHQLPDGGYSFDWEYKMGGVVLCGSGRHTDIMPYYWFVCETKSAIDCKITWTFRRLGKRTVLFFTIDYRLPIPVLGWLAEKTILKMNDSEADSLLSNIKEKLEMGHRPVRKNHDIQLVKYSK